MPSRAEFQARIRRVRSRLSDEMLSATQASMSALYVKAARRVSREMRTKLSLDTVDDNAVKALTRQPVLRQSFSKLSRLTAAKMQEVFEKAYQDPQGLSREAIAKELRKVAEISDSRARLIARTESAKISARARYTQYRKRPDFNESLFRWVGPSDHRETDTSKRIKRRVGRGVRWDVLVRIVQEESAKDFPTWTVDPESPVSHWNSRHTFVRVGSIS